ncbi:hypothetical protein PHYC_02893 [Phycisphaerales bacterium]|nr:hypothetical protein PHYC_02893 [Phycisphaerales bacterium]
MRGSSIRLHPEAAPGVPAEPPPPKIQAFESKLGAKRHEDAWKRSPNVTGTGAIHVRTFHCKLSDDAIGYLDQQINEWLDAHPQYEVKFSSSKVGEWTGKLGKEAHLVVQVWV